MLTDQDHQDSISEATHQLSSSLPKPGRNHKELPGAFGGQAVPVTVASQEAQGPCPHSNVSHFTPYRREVHGNQVSRTRQRHPLTENVFSLLLIKIRHCLSPSQTQRPNKALAKTHFAGLGEAPVVSSLAC